MNGKLIITKVLSIVCLLGVLAGGVLPCMTLTGNYQELLGGLTSMTESIPEDQYESIEQMVGQLGYTVDVKGTMEAITSLVEPINDGEIAIMDFYTISQNANVVAKELSGITPVEIEDLAETLGGIEIPEGEELPEEMIETLQPIVDTVNMLIQFGTLASMISMVALVPVAIFGLLAFAVVVRILLRLFNRRGLGVLISLFTIVNAALMMAIPYALSMMGADSLPFGVENTPVPIVMVVCSILSCIIWGIGRNAAKVKVVKEETPVAEQPVATPVETATEETAEEVAEEVVEDVVADTTEETAVEDVVEEVVTTEEAVEAAEETTETK